MWAQAPGPDDIRAIARVEPSILVPRVVYQPEDRIVFQLILRNPSTASIDLAPECLTAEPLSLERLRDKQVLKPGKKIEGLTGGSPTVGAAQTRTVDLDLRRLYKRLDEPGRYRISWSCGSWQSDHYDFVLGAPYDREKDRGAIVTTDLGAMEIAFMPEVAPIHVRNFVQLARAGYYDGVVFTQIVPGASAETGDPRGNGDAAFAQQLEPEIDQGVRPAKGMIGAARRDTSTTSATLFFFLLDGQPSFQGKHTFFAYVKSGWEVLDALAAIPVGMDGGYGGFRPLKVVRVQKIEIKPE